MRCSCRDNFISISLQLLKKYAGNKYVLSVLNNVHLLSVIDLTVADLILSTVANVETP